MYLPWGRSGVCIERCSNDAASTDLHAEIDADADIKNLGMAKPPRQGLGVCLALTRIRALLNTAFPGVFMGPENGSLRVNLRIV